MITDSSLCVVNTNTLSIWDFGNAANISQIMEKAVNSNLESIARLNMQVVDYPHMQTYLDIEMKAEFEILTYKEFIELERTTLLSPPLVEITKEQYYEMLNVLPPLKWCKRGNVELFCASEFWTSTYTSQYARLGDKYYSKMVDAYAEDTWIHNLLTGCNNA